MCLCSDLLVGKYRWCTYLPLIDMLENTSVCILHLLSINSVLFEWWVFSLFASPPNSLSGAGVLCCCIVFIQKHSTYLDISSLASSVPFTCRNRCILMFPAAVHTIIYNIKNVHSHMTSQKRAEKGALVVLNSCISWPQL